jgi:hypothetical protein
METEYKWLMAKVLEEIEDEAALEKHKRNVGSARSEIELARSDRYVKIVRIVANALGKEMPISK